MNSDSTTVTIFDSASLSNESIVFLIKDQVTITATGMLPDDYLTFEIISVSDAMRSTVCGCILTPVTLPSVSAITPLMCPTCESDTPQYVRLTDRNPVVVLDSPQGALVRAIYHGDGVSLRLVTAKAVTSTTTQDLTDTMRGCPPVCCEDEPQTWEDTGVRRCDDLTEIVEVQQISNCGNYQWIPSPDQPQEYWADTGVQACRPDGNVYKQEINPCGDAMRWSLVGPQVWTDTGVKRCTATNVEYQQTNQCGDPRWLPREAVVWTPTGNRRCLGEFVQTEETNQCGDERWNDTQEPVVWTPVGEPLCYNELVYQREVNQCGTTRVVPTGEFCPISEHTVTLTPILDAQGNQVVEGENACWLVTVTPAVSGANLPIDFTLSGTEQAIHNYAAPDLIIAIGQNSGVVCVPTTDDTNPEGTQQLCLNVVVSDRIPAPVSSCVDVLDNDTILPINIVNTPPGMVMPGEDVCYEVELNYPAPAGGFPVTVTISGDVNEGGEFCASYDGSTQGPVICTQTRIVPAGERFITVCLSECP